MQAYGLQTHIWNNNWKSALLLLGFPFLLLVLTYALLLIYAALWGDVAALGADIQGPFRWAWERFGEAWPYALIAAGLWFAVAYAFFQVIIDASTGAKLVTRSDAPVIYALLENLAISRGEPMPALRIVETPALNAFATGLHRGQYSITLTRGLVEALNEAELEAVLAHEFTHIRNHDVRMLVIAAVFVGIFSLAGEIAFRALRAGALGPPRAGRSRARGRSGGGRALLALGVALVLIALAYALALIIRFALSRRREYLADAGAVELTKNPDAMISALQKISRAAAFEGPPAEIREMFIENPRADFAGLFATHPPIERRIDALRRYAGGQGGSDVEPGNSA